MMRSSLLVASLMIGASCIPTAAHAADDVRIRLGTVVPDGSLWHQALRGAAVETGRLTERRVTVRVFAGTQGEEPEIVRKMRDGRLEAGWLTSAGLGTIDPALTVLALPHFYASDEELAHVVTVIEPLLAARLDARGFRMLDWSPVGWVHLFSRHPVRALADLEARRIAAVPGNERLADWYTRSGFQPVPLALADVFDRARAGGVDAIPATPLTALALNWYRPAPHMLETAVGPLIGATIVTGRTWDALSPADRETLEAAARRAAARIRSEAPAQDEIALTEMQKRGLTVTRFRSARERDAWSRAAEQFAESLRGSVVPADIYDAARRARDDFRSR